MDVLLECLSKSELVTVTDSIINIWDKDFKIINPEQIGYEYSRNNNFWKVTIPINRSYHALPIVTFLANPDIKCFGLCIVKMDENTDKECMYALGLYKCKEKDFAGITIKEKIQICDDDSMMQTILLLCSKQNGRTFHHFNDNKEWIHSSINDEKYKGIKDEIMLLFLAGKQRYQLTG